MAEEISVEKIKLILMNDTAYVWTSKDWLKLRNLRIVGNFIGSLAALPRQEQIAGLPLALLKEETTLLLEKGLAIVKKLSNILKPPNPDLQTKINHHRSKILSDQVKIFKRKRKAEIIDKIDVIIEGKKAKAKKLGKDISSQINKEVILQEEFSKIQSPKESSLVIQIPTDDPWIKEEDLEDCGWDYPKTEKENMNYLIFRDLWERGYYITTGGKFGGDYLAYPGDPVKFHAFFIVVCLEKDTKIGMNEIVTYGRLGQSVRKTVALAYLGDEGEVTYQSIQWSGF